LLFRTARARHRRTARQEAVLSQRVRALFRVGPTLKAQSFIVS